MEEIKVLIADDSMFMRSTIKKALAKAGLEHVLEAKNGQEAIDLYLEHQPYICILDITMPEKSGLEALQAIRESNPAAIVIMCSAIGQEATVMQAIKQGASQFIVKPFKEDKMIETVQEYL